MSNAIPISQIDDSGRLRPVDKDHAALIAASIEGKGKTVPPIVIRPTPDGAKPYKLTIGGHRLEAFRMIGLTELVPGEHVVIVEQDDLSARISEIDENLTRHELNVLDRAFFLAERRRLYDEQNRVTGHGGNRKDNKFKDESKSHSMRLGYAPRFTQEVADRVGLSERSIQLALRIVQKLDREAAAAIRGTLVETNRNELLMFVELPPEEQRKVAARIKGGESKTVTEAKIALGLAPKPSDDPQAALYATLQTAWAKADEQTRKTFLAWTRAKR